MDESTLLARLEVIDQDRAFLRFLTPVAHDDAGTVDNFARVAFAIEDACLERGERD